MLAQASTQASIVGVVKDASGAVLPGVTIDASSPALIEKVRTTVSGGSGEYKLVGLPPGTYTVTFTLTGFNVFKREGVIISGAGTTEVNAALAVGAVSETITVSGEAPTVDVQGSVRSENISADTIADTPVPKIYSNLLNLVPGTVATGVQDVGGQNGPAVITFAIHGGRTNEGRVEVNGLGTGSTLNGAGTSYYVTDITNAQEVQFNTSGGLGESETGGGVINIVPKTGGNQVHGTLYGNGATSGMVSSNFTSTLQNQGLKAPNSLQNIWDANGSVGGPIKQDKVWYFVGDRYQGNDKLVANMWQNVNCTFQSCNQNILTYTPNYNAQATGDGRWYSTNGRLTWQESPRNKLQFFTDYQRLCINCQGAQPGGAGATTGAGTAPEAAARSDARPQWVQQVSWSSPMTNKLLLEAGFSSYRATWGGAEPNPNATVNGPQITELCSPSCPNNGGIGPVVYHSANWADNFGNSERWQASGTYVTGSQSMKFGYQGERLDNVIDNYTNNQNLGFTFNNGVPLSLTEYAYHYWSQTIFWQNSLYAQDVWTRGRFTLSGGIRYDHASSGFPQQQVGPTTFVPVPVVFSAQAGVTGYNDITPRVSAVWDVFGNGKTAVRITTGKYLEAGQTGVAYAGPNPLNLLPASVTRTWKDTSGTLNPYNDCDLLNPLANGGCGTISNLSFGTSNLTAAYDPAVLSGWGIRPSDWTTGVSVQQQLLPRTSLEVGYFRRQMENFLVTDNQALNGSNATPFSVVAPTDARLPGGGGYTLSGLYNEVPSVVGQTNSLVTYANNIASNSMYAYANSIDVQLTMRNYKGLSFQGGTSSIDSVLDSCAIKAALPLGLTGAQTITSNAVSNNPWCHSDSGWLTDFRAIMSYLLPRGGVQVSATLQSNPGAGSSPTFGAGSYGQPGLQANLVYTSAQVASSLGRPLAGVSTVTVNVLQPGTLYGQRINQLDLRASKTLKWGGQRLLIGVDLYNALNANTITAYNQTYGTAWLTPTAILASRFAKLSVQYDF